MSAARCLGGGSVKTVKYANGDVYKGEIKNGKPHGKGVYSFVNGDVFEGMFMEGKKSGKGILRTNDGEVKKVEFVDDKRVS